MLVEQERKFLKFIEYLNISLDNNNNAIFNKCNRI